MTYRRIDPGLARLLDLGLDHELGEHVGQWKDNLAQGRVSAEMQDVFVALGWLSSRRDSRLGEEVPEDKPATQTRAQATSKQEDQNP